MEPYSASAAEATDATASSEPAAAGLGMGPRRSASGRRRRSTAGTPGEVCVAAARTARRPDEPGVWASGRAARSGLPGPCEVA